jgi:transcription antitermination factor NusG
VIHAYGGTDTPYIPSQASEPLRWYAIHTRAQHEKRVEMRLRECGISIFLPLVRQVHRWSDRRKEVELPLFSCYAFIHVIPTAQTRLRILRTPGVIGFVGFHGEGTPIPDRQIDDVRSLISSGVPFTEYPFLKIGQRVRIRGGSLDGIEGAIVAGHGNRKLVVSVELIQRSIAVTVEGYDVEAA